MSTTLMKQVDEVKMKKRGNRCTPEVKRYQTKIKWCFAVLVLIALTDGTLSAYVFYTLSKKTTDVLSLDMAAKMDKLYESECFTRQQDRVIFETSETLKNYVGAVVVAQTALAFSDAVAHVFAARNTDNQNKVQYTAYALEIGELIAAGIGVYEYMSVKDSFIDMYNEMNDLNSTAACVQSCCAPAAQGASASAVSLGYSMPRLVLIAICGASAATAALLFWFLVPRSNKVQGSTGSTRSRQPKDKQPVKAANRKCSGCKKLKTEKDFGTNQWSKPEGTSNCKACMKECSACKKNYPKGTKCPCKKQGAK
jgi:hypothetical protein